MEAKGFYSSRFNPLVNIQTLILYGYSLFLSKAHAILQNLVNSVYQALEISIRLHVSFTLLVVFLSGVITVIFHRQVVYLNSD